MRQKSWILASVTISLMALVVTAQTPSPVAGVIRGRITSAATGRPLRRARVSLLPVSETAGRVGISASTNALGQFELKDVPNGSYYVSAARAGHVRVQFGQTRAATRGVVVDVVNGQTLEHVDISLPPAGVIAGGVLDELGEPYQGVRISVLEVRYRNGHRLPFPAGSAVTDDLGRYRISGLRPGRYIVSAASPEMWQNERKETFAYATTYYSGSTSLDLAQPIDLSTSQERLDIDVTLSVARAVRVSGRALLPSGDPLSGEPVRMDLTYAGTGAIVTGTGLSTRTQGDGTFEMKNVPPGDYVVRAKGASRSIAVRDADVSNLVLTARTGSTVVGSVVTDDGTPAPFAASTLRLYLVPADDSVLPTVRLPAINNDWSFRLMNLGGPFFFRVRGAPDDWMVSAVRLNDRDITDTPYDVPTGGRVIDGLQVVLSKRSGKISGAVVDAADRPVPDATVVIFSEDEEKWTVGSRFVRATRPNRDGQFSVTGLPSGMYLIVANPFVLDGQWDDREFLEAAAKGAARQYLSDGGQQVVKLRLTK